MEMNGAVASSAILVMGLVGLFSVAARWDWPCYFGGGRGTHEILPLGLCGVPLFAMGLEARGTGCCTTGSGARR